MCFLKTQSDFISTTHVYNLQGLCTLCTTSRISSDVTCVIHLSPFCIAKFALLIFVRVVLLDTSRTIQKNIPWCQLSKENRLHRIASRQHMPKLNVNCMKNDINYIANNVTFQFAPVVYHLVNIQDTIHLVLLKRLIAKKNNLQRDLQEFEQSLLPKYQDIISSIKVQYEDLETKSKDLIRAVHQHGADWHKEIDNIINMKKS